MAVLIGVMAFSIIPMGMYRRKKWAMWTALVIGGLMTFSLICFPFADDRHGYGSFDASARFVMFFWWIPRSIMFMLLLLPKSRRLFASTEK